ncbi:hypothetical protein F5X98DRAFT_383227 [Xylaria grammica]|nr:hypothetical protein F5X98DRAFT_383227 [Xylaria grammica]
MLPDQPPSTPIPAHPINVPGLTCTGTTSGTNVNYVCHRSSSGFPSVTQHEFGHLLKPQFWILAVLIFYSVRVTYSEGAHQIILRLLTKLSPGSNRESLARARVTQIGALLASLGILWLVWIEAPMVLDTDRQMMRKVFVTWQPKLTPLRLRLLVLYPVWAIISIFCTVMVASTIIGGIMITKTQTQCVIEMALLVLGRRQLDGDSRSPDPSRESGPSEHRNGSREEKQNEGEDTKTLAPTSEKS